MFIRVILWDWINHLIYKIKFYKSPKFWMCLKMSETGKKILKHGICLYVWASYDIYDKPSAQYFMKFCKDFFFINIYQFPKFKKNLIVIVKGVNSLKLSWVSKSKYTDRQTKMIFLHIFQHNKSKKKLWVNLY